MDYKRIIDSIDETKAGKLFSKLGIQYRDEGDHFVMPTYCHHRIGEQASEKLYYYKNSHLFMCYTCCGSMSWFSFLKHFYEAQGAQYDWYKDIYCVLTDYAEVSAIMPNVEAYSERWKLYNEDILAPLTPIPTSLLETFVSKFYPPEWTTDGILPSTMDKFNIRYAVSQNKIIIPHYNADGELIGIRGRALNPEEAEYVGKYMPVQISGKIYSHPLSRNLYGLNENKENIKKYRYAVLAESEKSVLQAESFSMPNCTVAVCGSHINRFQIELLIKECSPQEIIIALDKEQVKGSNAYFEKLQKMAEKYKNFCKISIIYDIKNRLQLKDSPFDRGEETFKALLKERIKL